MANMAAVQILININGQSLTVSNEKKNVVSLKVSRVLGDAANKFTLELFDETAWKLESALYNTKQASISIQYGATGEWANGKHITFTGFVSNYNLSFVGAATMLSIEGIIHGVEGVDGAAGASFWFVKDTIQWVDTDIGKPSGEEDANSASWRAGCSVDGKWWKAGLGPDGAGDQGFEDEADGEYADYICAKIDWFPPNTKYNSTDTWTYKIYVNPSNIFKRIIRKYNGETGYGQYDQDSAEEEKWEVLYGGMTQEWWDTNWGGFGNFEIGDVDDSLWVDASCIDCTQTNETAAEFITNTLCKAAIKPGSNSAGFKYYVRNGKHYFKAIDYSTGGSTEVVKTGYYMKDSNVISFSLNQSGILVMAGKDTDEDGNPLVDASSMSSLSGDFIDTNLYNFSGHYVDEESMESEDKENSINWYFKKVSSVKVTSSSSQTALTATVQNAFDNLQDLTLSAALTIWGEYNNTYVPGNYIDLTVMTPDGKKHYSSGKYFIISADDNITADGYTTTLKLLKNTNNSASGNKFNVETTNVTPQNWYEGINPYTDSGAGGSELTAADVALSTNEVSDLLWSLLTGKGFSKAATAGIMGNCYQESGFNPAANGAAIGLFQFENSTGNSAGYLAYASNANKAWTDVSCQVDYMISQLSSAFVSYTGKVYTYSNGTVTWWPEKMTLEQFKQKTDCQLCAEIFCRVYERPSIPMMANRKKYAQDAYNKYA